MSIELHCPHCQHAHDDPWEVLDVDKIDQMKCEGCHRAFHFALMECQRCAEETAHSWAHAPAPEALRLLTCPDCGATYRDEAADADVF